MTAPEKSRDVLSFEDAGTDPLEGIPAEVVERAGSADTDSAGGCG